MEPLFNWFGGKRRIATQVWKCFGEVQRYIEPFSGSAAVLLGRPESQIIGQELLNDLDGLIVNFWRTAQADPVGLASALDFPVSELDLIARKTFFVHNGDHIVQKLRNDPEYFDVRAAAWWFYGHQSSVGNRWLRANEIPNRFMPQMNTRSMADRAKDITHLSQRLLHTTLLCGEWDRTVGSNKVLFNGTSSVGVFLDPPYSAARTGSIYRDDDFQVANDVREWCTIHGNDPRLRIIIAGYDHEHDALEQQGWRCYKWSASGGHANRNKAQDDHRNKEQDNRNQETVWCSPHCIRPDLQVSLFDAIDARRQNFLPS
jgi:DNA adenine methylase